MMDGLPYDKDILVCLTISFSHPRLLANPRKTISKVYCLHWKSAIQFVYCEYLIFCSTFGYKYLIDPFQGNKILTLSILEN